MSQNETPADNPHAWLVEQRGIALRWAAGLIGENNRASLVCYESHLRQLDRLLGMNRTEVLSDPVFASWMREGRKW